MPARAPPFSIHLPPSTFPGQRLEQPEYEIVSISVEYTQNEAKLTCFNRHCKSIASRNLQQAQPRIAQLPMDLLLILLRHFGLQSLGRLAQTCRSFNILVKSS